MLRPIKADFLNSISSLAHAFSKVMQIYKDTFYVFFFGSYLPLALNNPVKIYSLIHANKKLY